MAVSYKKLWKLLIDKDMKKEELRVAAGISTNTMAKLGKNENVNTEMLVKICSALKCDIADIMEIIETETAIFVVRAESITDYENSTESEKGAADSIKDKIKAEWLEDKAVEKLKAMVNEKGDAYKVESKKEEDIKAINDSIFSKL